MKKFLSVFLILNAFVMNAQMVEVSGNQSGMWSGEVHLVGNVDVPAGEILTVEPGATVIADGYFGIFVYGGFVAEGDENARIVFTVADTTGYSDYEITDGGWKGIFLGKCTDNVRFGYCDFSYGKTELDGDGGAMNINFVNDVEIGNCRFHHNTMRKRGGAIFAEKSTLYIHDCEVYDNFGAGFQGSYCWGTGFQFLNCDVNMHDMVFHDNFCNVAYGGGMNIDSCNLVLDRAVFFNNYSTNAGGLGIQRSKHCEVKVSNVLAYNNCVIHYGGGLAVATSDPELNNLTIVDNYCGGGGGAGMQMAFESCPVLNNCIFYGNRELIVNNENDTVEHYDGSQIWLWGADCVPVFNNGLVQYGLDSIFGNYLISEENYNDMLDSDPLFSDAENHDYRLSANSPCIDAGKSDTTGMFIPDTDLAGGPRIFNGRIDMGCYEWNDFGINEVFASPNTLSVYPNPLNINSFCFINVDKRCDAVVKLVSLDGKEIYSENCGTLEVGENSIPLYGMIKKLEKKGEVYLLIIENQYNRSCSKVIY